MFQTELGARAQAYVDGHTDELIALIEALCRIPAPSHQEDQRAEFIQKWLHTYGFSQEMIILACDKTITATHNPSFEYADRILSSWKKAGITTPDQVESHDKEHQIKVNRKKAATASQPQSKPSNAFHNFEQRSTDYDRLVADYYGYRKQQ